MNMAEDQELSVMSMKIVNIQTDMLTFTFRVKAGDIPCTGERIGWWQAATNIWDPVWHLLCSS